MHSLAEIRAEYNRLDQKFGINTEHMDIEFSNRLTNTYGKTYSKNKIPYRIVIAGFLRTEEEQFYDTIRHEYAHALATIRHKANCGHDYRWQRAAVETGCKPDRLAQNCESRQNILASRKTYIVSCEKCGSKHTYLKMCKSLQSIMKNEKRYRCGKCGSDNLIANS